jgi:hypothetical protein
MPKHLIQAQRPHSNQRALTFDDLSTTSASAHTNNLTQLLKNLSRVKPLI